LDIFLYLETAGHEYSLAFLDQERLSNPVTSVAKEVHWNLKWLLFMDLDGTMWDNLDVSSCKLPFKPVDRDRIVDSSGKVISLNPDSREFLKWARDMGAIISTCTWNETAHVMGALEAFGLKNAFDYFQITNDSRKDKIMKDLLDILHRKKVHIDHRNIFYLDDRDIHMDEIRHLIPEINFLYMGVHVKGFADAKKIISARLGF
jgi:magnesium-dependent phosphatase-1